MTFSASRKPEPDDLASARADLRDLQYRLAVVQQQEASLLRAIDTKVIEIDEIEHFGIREALGRIAARGR